MPRRGSRVRIPSRALKEIEKESSDGWLFFLCSSPAGVERFEVYAPLRSSQQVQILVKHKIAWYDKICSILDEYDEEEEQIVTDADGSYIIEGQADLEDVEAKLGIEFECEDIDTLSGFMIYKLGKIPDDGENFEVEYKGYIFRTLDVRGRMILKVKVEKTSQEQHA